jgi:hypothetical protein
MNCFYAYIEGISDSLVLTVNNNHITRFDCSSREVMTDKYVAAGDSAVKVIKAYAKLNQTQKPDSSQNDEYSLWTENEGSRMIFIIKNNLVDKIIVGVPETVIKKEGCDRED